MKTEQERKDYFAAHALQGLLASGQFTTKTEDGGVWAVIEKDPIGDDGKELECPRHYPAVVELAWRMADWMIRDES